jgi:hypothetical protein
MIIKELRSQHRCIKLLRSHLAYKGICSSFIGIDQCIAHLTSCAKAPSVLLISRLMSMLMIMCTRVCSCPRSCSALILTLVPLFLALWGAHLERHSLHGWEVIFLTDSSHETDHIVALSDQPGENAGGVEATVACETCAFFGHDEVR